jgi:glucokinase
MAIVSYIHIFNPQMVILGGSVALVNWKILSRHVDKVVKRNAMKQFQSTVRIRRASLGDLSGILGAAVMAHEGRVR